MAQGYLTGNLIAILLPGIPPPSPVPPWVFHGSAHHDTYAASSNEVLISCSILVVVILLLSALVWWGCFEAAEGE